MTRVEKYAEYRKEIQNSFKDTSTKEKSASRVDKILKDNHGSSQTINYDDVMNAYEIYGNEEDTPTKKHHISAKSIVVGIIYGIIIAGLVVALILVGIKAFGGK